MSKLHAHVAQSAETHDADFLALCDAPMPHGRVGCDSGAEQRRGAGEIEVGGHAKHKALVHDDAFGIAAVGDAAEVLVRRIVSERGVRAELLEAGLALGAGAIGIHHAARPRARSPGLNFVTAEPTLVTRPTISWPGTHRVDRGHDVFPLIAHLMQIGVADAAE